MQLLQRTQIVGTDAVGGVEAAEHVDLTELAVGEAVTMVVHPTEQPDVRVITVVSMPVEEKQAKSSGIVGIIVEEKVANATIFVVGAKCAAKSTRRIYIAV